MYISTECQNHERTAKTVIVSTTTAHPMDDCQHRCTDFGEVPRKARFMVTGATIPINERGRPLSKGVSSATFFLVPARGRNVRHQTRLSVILQITEYSN